ncbi:MAG: isopentenyl transferase family protein, partial [Pseudomonadota bacterium]
MSLLTSSLQLSLDDPQACTQYIQKNVSPRIVCLAGPTASGKTALALELAKYLPCEIVNVDSALVYRDMNIGTAKPTDIELSQVPHHLINILNPTESFSVADFCERAKKLIIEIVNRGNWPILVGGTMMYFRGLI